MHSKSISQTGGILHRPLRTMTARDGTPDVEGGIPLQDLSQRQDNFPQANDNNR